MRTWPQPGHFPVLPAASSFTTRRRPHGHEKWIGMADSPVGRDQSKSADEVADAIYMEEPSWQPEQSVQLRPTRWRRWLLVTLLLLIPLATVVALVVIPVLLPKDDRIVTTYSNQTRASVPAFMFEFTPAAGTEVSTPLGQ